MQVVSATYRDGQIVLDTPVNWPDGTRISVVPVIEDFGLNESDWPITEAGIRELLTRMDSGEPLEFTAEDDAAIEAARAASRKEVTENWERHVAELEQLF